MTEAFQIWNEDCVTGMATRLAANSVGLCVTSIPFGALFTYSGRHDDIGNNADGIDLRAGEFGLHMRFFVQQLYRVMIPGGNVVIHIQQLLTTKVQHGHMGRRDFRGAVIDLFAGLDTDFRTDKFDFCAEAAIPKDPQAIARRQQLHSLQFMTGHSRDARALAPAVCDFALFFRKPGEPPYPVRSIQDPETNAGGWVTRRDWIEWAHGVWNIPELDIMEGFKSAREQDDEKHVCPLQLQFIHRPVMLYTNPGDLVLDPFMGVGSTAWVALGGPTKIGKLRVNAPRRVVGFELKGSYHALAVRNAQTAMDNWAEFASGSEMGQGGLEF